MMNPTNSYGRAPVARVNHVREPAVYRLDHVLPPVPRPNRRGFTPVYTGAGGRLSRATDRWPRLGFPPMGPRSPLYRTGHLYARGETSATGNDNGEGTPTLLFEHDFRIPGEPVPPGRFDRSAVDFCGTFFFFVFFVFENVYRGGFFLFDSVRRITVGGRFLMKYSRRLPYETTKSKAESP